MITVILVASITSLNNTISIFSHLKETNFIAKYEMLKWCLKTDLIIKLLPPMSEKKLSTTIYRVFLVSKMSLEIRKYGKKHQAYWK